MLLLFKCKHMINVNSQTLKHGCWVFIGDFLRQTAFVQLNMHIDFM